MSDVKGEVRRPVPESGTRTAEAPRAARGRILALDAHRGLAIVMLILVNTAGIRSSLPYHLDHPEWHGLTFADTFFPVFLFAMGAAMEFSSRAQRVPSVLRRVVLLFALGVGLSWLRNGEPNVTGVLQKIAVAYLLAWLVLRLPRRFHLLVAVGVLVLAWAAFTWAPPAGVVAGSWEPGTNFAAYVDRLVIGHPSTEGFATAVMATVNVLGGALVIRGIKGMEGRDALRRILWWTVGAVAVGLLLSLAIPVNKRIWTPSFTVLSHGFACAYLAAFWWVTEIRNARAWVRPLVVLGRNPVFLYVLLTATHVVLEPVRVPLTGALADQMPDMAASFVWSGGLLIAAVGLAEWMDRRRLYVRV